MPLREPSSPAPILGRRVAKYFDGIPYPGIWGLKEFKEGAKCYEQVWNHRDHPNCWYAARKIEKLPVDYEDKINVMAWTLNKKSKQATYYPVLIIHPCVLAEDHPLLKEQPTPQYVYGYYGQKSTPFGRVSASKWDTPMLLDWQTGLDRGLPDKLPKGGRGSPYFKAAEADAGLPRRLRGLELCVHDEDERTEERRLQELEMRIAAEAKPAFKGLKHELFENAAAQGQEAKIPMLPKGATVSVLYDGLPYEAVILSYSRVLSEYTVKFTGDNTTRSVPVDTVTFVDLKRTLRASQSGEEILRRNAKKPARFKADFSSVWAKKEEEKGRPGMDVVEEDDDYLGGVASSSSKKNKNKNKNKKKKVKEKEKEKKKKKKGPICVRKPANPNNDDDGDKEKKKRPGSICVRKPSTPNNDDEDDDTSNYNDDDNDDNDDSSIGFFGLDPYSPDPKPIKIKRSTSNDVETDLELLGLASKARPFSSFEEKDSKCNGGRPSKKQKQSNSLRLFSAVKNVKDEEGEALPSWLQEMRRKEAEEIKSENPFKT
ncbi:hypothetical protein TrVE_jg11086 [Triparma verrucosa]|uniref:Uncharacterized protein n=1 Tax=Triparma verrucosa TaxID=1606542 RepID=A0A9W7C7K1_9STRA|nr:hypothetical protein TrVE_jg11086 [Triparma verrucosa]